MADYAIVATRLPTGLNVTNAKMPMQLNGANASNASSGFGYTRVPTEFVKDWLGSKGHGQSMDAFKNGDIFTAATIEEARKEAASRRGDASGFDGLDPDKPAAGIEPTDEMKTELKKIMERDPNDPDALDTSKSAASAGPGE